MLIAAIEKRERAELHSHCEERVTFLHTEVTPYDTQAWQAQSEIPLLRSE